jgi:hypothetical protein
MLEMFRYKAKTHMLNKLHDKIFLAWNILHVFTWKQTHMSKVSILLLKVRPCVDVTVSLRWIIKCWFTARYMVLLNVKINLIH